MRQIHLICNSHLDPMWQWEWEEGAAAAVSTFRCAADFCEEFDTFIFNHNESLLYQWTEEYEPELFTRIQRLVKEGKWRIIGGWFVQPDCNMLSGESFIRQIESGRKYFKEKFGVTPTTALNFDSFGHSRGLVQILTKAGYDSYLFVRPGYDLMEIPQRDFWWQGYDGSRVLAHNLFMGYGANLGGAAKKLNSYINDNTEFKSPAALFWGVGNHGGGPSRQDINALNKFAETLKEQGIEAFHSTPEEYFANLRKGDCEVPVYKKSLRPSNPGCYTSQIRLKQKHRELEYMLATVEQMSAMADMNGLLQYPHDEIAQAERDLLFTQFHDVLPGSSIPPVEENGLQMMAHGLEILSRLRAKLFFRLSKGLERTLDGEIPILVYNPQPYAVIKDIECEFTLADHNWDDDSIFFPTAFDGECALPSQLEKEHANTNLDWRKRVVFRGTLQPSSISRFNCKLEKRPIMDNGTNDTWKTKQVHSSDKLYNTAGTHLVFTNANMHAEINLHTGLLECYEVNGIPLVDRQGIRLTLCRDSEDSWGMHDYVVNDYISDFKVASPEDTGRIAGVNKPLPPVSVVENGEVRSVIEATFVCQNSWAVFHWIIPKHDNKIELRLRVFADETDKLFKLRFPAAMRGNRRYLGQDAFGTSELEMDGSEQVSLCWTAIADENAALLVINDGIYGSDYTGGSLNLSLLRTPAYCSHRLLQRAYLPDNRYTPRMDQGGHEYRFLLAGGDVQSVLATADKEAQMFNQSPYAVSFFPSGAKEPKPLPAVSFMGNTPVVMTSLKKAGDKDGYLMRVFNPTEELQQVFVESPVLKVMETIPVPALEAKTFLVSNSGIKPTDFCLK